MNVKLKVAIGLVMLLLIGGGLINCIQDMVPVWAKVKLDTSMDVSEYYWSNVCGGKLYYGMGNQVVEINPISGKERAIELDFREEKDSAPVKSQSIYQVAMGGDGSIYAIVSVKYDIGEPYSWGNGVVYLCKFTSNGRQIYATDITQQQREVAVNGWSSLFLLEVDGKGRVYLAHQYKLFLYDENGNYHKCIDVNPEESLSGPQIWDMVSGRDGSMYLYYMGANDRLVQVDFETGTLINGQDVLYGELFCFDFTDGFYVKAGESLYHYATDIPTVGRLAEKVLDWWDLLIYKDNVEMIAAPAEDCILVTVVSTLEDRCGVFLIRKMPRWEAKEGGYTYVEIP